jgi:hypothetical protein
MEQLLLLTFTDKKAGKATRMENVREDMTIAMKQMKRFLNEAANDLLQPRPEAIQQILLKAAK